MSGGPWLVVVQTRKRIVACYLQTTPRGRDTREAMLQDLWDESVATVKSYDLPALLHEAETGERADILELQRMMRL